MDSDLKRSGLTREDVNSRPDPARVGKDYSAAYMLPYHDVDGTPISGMYRTRQRALPQATKYAKKQRYHQPSRSEQPLYYNMPYIPPQGCQGHDTLVVCEGEKKAVCVAKYVGGVDVIGIGGCWNWADTDEEGNTTLHPLLLQVASAHERVVVVPDGDFERYDISRAYGAMCRLLEDAGVAVEITATPGKIDDLIMEWGGQAKENFWALPTAPLESFINPIATWAHEYGLTTDSKGNPHWNETNVKTLLAKHPSLPEFWYDTDSSKRMMGEEPLDEQNHPFDLISFMQSKWAWITANKRSLLRDAMFVACEAHKRSPLFEEIKATEWDGKPRLADLLPHYMQSEDTETSREVSIKWLVAAIARMDNPGCDVQYMLVTVGPQRVGKSTFPTILFGGVGEGGVVNILGKETQSKDRYSKYHTGRCVNFEELEHLNTAELGELKADISNAVDSYRAPYARQTQSLRRGFVMYGSTNKMTFLPADESGHRRWAVVRVEGLRMDELVQDRAQLWAEAYHLYRSGTVKYAVCESSIGKSQYAHEDEDILVFKEELQRALEEGNTDIGPRPWIYVAEKDGLLSVGVNVRGGITYIKRGGSVLRYSERDFRDHLKDTGWVHKKSWVYIGTKQLRNYWVLEGQEQIDAYLDQTE